MLPLFSWPSSVSRLPNPSGGDPQKASPWGTLTNGLCLVLLVSSGWLKRQPKGNQPFWRVPYLETNEKQTHKKGIHKGYKVDVGQMRTPNGCLPFGSFKASSLTSLQPYRKPGTIWDGSPGALAPATPWRPVPKKNLHMDVCLASRNEAI